MTLTLLCAGCGGSGSPPFQRGGRLAVRIAWPSESLSRVIPVATKAIRLEVRRGATVLASTLVERPGSGALFPEIPIGGVSVRATAYPDPAATGVALAGADVATTVTDGLTATVPLTLASTIDSVQVAPSSVTLFLSLVSTRHLTVTARNAQGTVVLVAPEDLQFTSAAPLIALVSSGGTVVGLLPGTTTVTVRERTSGRTFMVPVTVIA